MGLCVQLERGGGEIVHLLARGFFFYNLNFPCWWLWLFSPSVFFLNRVHNLR
eukprot:m.217067 g.217067  ORF g.217067 m.217067 type:complete len:52 (-) comp22230_c1_seq2:47-202(-)